jgi:lipoate synthase
MQFSRRQAQALEIESLQSALKGLHFHKPHQSVSTGPLVPGCQICVRRGYLSFQLGFACNASCPFCFLQTRPSDQPDPDERYHRQALMHLACSAGSTSSRGDSPPT